MKNNPVAGVILLALAVLFVMIAFTDKGKNIFNALFMPLPESAQDNKSQPRKDENGNILQWSGDANGNFAKFGYVGEKPAKPPAEVST